MNDNLKNYLQSELSLGVSPKELKKRLFNYDGYNIDQKQESLNVLDSLVNNDTKKI